MSDGTVKLYYPGMTAKELAEKVLESSYGDDIPSIPIDPFKLMREYGIVYQFRGFSGLEGIYLVPEDENDIAVVGINYLRPITRQRFTAAHELCHHIKDHRDEACPIAKFETVDWHEVANELIKLQNPVEKILKSSSEMTVSEYVCGCMKIHHRITQIHPFRDGNAMEESGDTTVAPMH